jgi:hypothetical protein
VWWGSTVFDGLSGWPGWAAVRAALPVPGVVVDTLVLSSPWSAWWHCSTALVAAVQIAAVLMGHVVAVVVAHDRCVALLPPDRRLADQIPLVLLMVAYTMVGLFLLVIS